MLSDCPVRPQSHLEKWEHIILEAQVDPNTILAGWKEKGKGERKGRRTRKGRERKRRIREGGGEQRGGWGRGSRGGSEGEGLYKTLQISSFETNAWFPPFAALITNALWRKKHEDFKAVLKTTHFLPPFPTLHLQKMNGMSCHCHMENLEASELDNVSLWKYLSHQALHGQSFGSVGSICINSINH